MLLRKTAVKLLDVLKITLPRGRWHTGKRNFAALSYRLSGGSETRFGGERVRAAAGDVLLVPNDMDYDAVREREESLIVFHFLLIGESDGRIEGFSSPAVAALAPRFAEAYEIFTKKEAGYYYRTSAILYEILAVLVGERTVVGDDDLVCRAKDYFERHFCEADLTVARAAHDLGVSTALLRRKFQTAGGGSPKEVLGAMRIERAKALLEAGYFSHAEVAALCGFADVKYFRTAFRLAVGETPSEFRYRFQAKDPCICP